MADVIKSEHSPKSLPLKYKDMGDGSFAVVVAATVSGSGGSTADREIIATPYRVKTAFTGASVNDTITSIRVLDVSTTPTQVGDTLWYNETTQLPLASAPSMANLEPMLTTGLTAAQLTAAGLATQTTLAAVLAKLSADPATQTTLAAILAKIIAAPATEAKQDSAITLLGVKTDGSTALPAGGVGIIGWLSNLWQSFFGVASGSADSGNPIKVGGIYNSNNPVLTANQRGNMRVSINGALLTTPLFNTGGLADGIASANMRGILDNGSNVVIQAVQGYVYDGTAHQRLRGDANYGVMSNVLSVLGAAKQIPVAASTGLSASVPLTTTARRISIFANGTDMRYVIGTGAQTATSTSHFISAGERLDLNVPANSVVAALSATASTGSLEISELA